MEHEDVSCDFNDDNNNNDAFDSGDGIRPKLKQISKFFTAGEKKFTCQHSATKLDESFDSMAISDSRRSLKHQSPYAYRMTHGKRGRCIVINNKKFDAVTEMPYRTGSDKDAARVDKTFSSLGFEVTIEKDCSADEMRTIIKNVSAEDHSDSDCLAVVVLSHGSEGVIYGRDTLVYMNELVAPLKGSNCTSLVGKPKLFFIQACRGEQFDDGVEVPKGDGFDETDSGPVTLPQESDILYAYSTTSGYFSWRSGAEGSYFIQSLCAMIDKYSCELDLVRILTRVHHHIATEFKSQVKSNPEQTNKRQMPSLVSMLTKDLYLTPKHLISSPQKSNERDNLTNGENSGICDGRCSNLSNGSLENC